MRPDHTLYFWRISLYVTDDAIGKALCDVKFIKIKGNEMKS